MKVTVVGCGYVGLVTAACLADLGHFVAGVDNDKVKIDLLLKGEIPIYEIGLEGIVKHNMQEKRLTFSEQFESSVHESQIIFLAVGTPPQEDGSANLTQIIEVAREIGNCISQYTVIVNKSTVPVGTGKLVQKIVRNCQKNPVEFDVVSNPEFLREGSAIEDFFHPDRVVIGTDSEKSVELMKELYKNLKKNGTPFIFTGLETAELIKYASNAFLATKISFINEIANLCEAVGGEIQALVNAIGLDHRIGREFLKPGPGYGGSCFPKDTNALIHIARTYGEPVTIVENVAKVNENQKQRMVQKIKRVVGDINGKTLTILGLAFKPNTDDMREAPSIQIIQGLLDAGARIKAHDPAAIKEAQKIFAGTIEYYDDIYEAATDVDAMVVITEWSCYYQLDLTRLKKIMRSPIIIDLRNIFFPQEVINLGFRYEGIGRPTK